MKDLLSILYEEKKKDFKFDFLISLLVFIVGILLVLYLSKRISEPIAYVVKRIESISKGDYTLDFDTRYLSMNDER